MVSCVGSSVLLPPVAQGREVQLTAAGVALARLAMRQRALLAAQSQARRTGRRVQGGPRCVKRNILPASACKGPSGAVGRCYVRRNTLGRCAGQPWQHSPWGGRPMAHNRYRGALSDALGDHPSTCTHQGYNIGRRTKRGPKGPKGPKGPWGGVGGPQGPPGGANRPKSYYTH